MSKETEKDNGVHDKRNGSESYGAYARVDGLDKKTLAYILGLIATCLNGFFYYKVLQIVRTEFDEKHKPYNERIIRAEGDIKDLKEVQRGIEKDVGDFRGYIKWGVKK